MGDAAIVARYADSAEGDEEGERGGAGEVGVCSEFQCGVCGKQRVKFVINEKTKGLNGNEKSVIIWVREERAKLKKDADWFGRTETLLQLE